MPQKANEPARSGNSADPTVSATTPRATTHSMVDMARQVPSLPRRRRIASANGPRCRDVRNAMAEIAIVSAIERVNAAIFKECPLTSIRGPGGRNAKRQQSPKSIPEIARSRLQTSTQCLVSLRRHSATVVESARAGYCAAPVSPVPASRSTIKLLR